MRWGHFLYRRNPSSITSFEFFLALRHLRLKFLQITVLVSANSVKIVGLKFDGHRMVFFIWLLYFLHVNLVGTFYIQTPQFAAGGLQGKSSPDSRLMAERSAPYPWDQYYRY